MKFSVGYQLHEEGEEPFADVLRDYREHVAEVYFPWGDTASGRASIATRRGYIDWTALPRMEAELLKFREMGLKLDLLFNANCHGGKGISIELRNQVGSILDHLHERVGGVDVVTTTSLFIARMIKDHYPQIEVRASVNMRLGQVQAMEDVADWFDSYYLQRDYNRDLPHLREVKEWAVSRKKGLHILANSGCLRFCAAQTFHDNLVAHDAEVDERQNVPGYVPHLCWNLMKKQSHWKRLVQATWIRPEDVRRYEGLVDGLKLATRMHARPRLVLQAYTSGKYHGNLLDLFEPSLTKSLGGHALDNDAFPDDWFERTSTCGGACHRCDYCGRVLQKVLVRPGE